MHAHIFDTVTGSSNVQVENQVFSRCWKTTGTPKIREWHVGNPSIKYVQICKGFVAQCGASCSSAPVFRRTSSKNYLFVNVTETSIQGLTIYETTRAHFLWEKSMHGSNTWWNVKDQEWGSGSPVHHDDFWGLWPLLSYYAVWHPHGRITIVFLGLLW